MLGLYHLTLNKLTRYTFHAMLWIMACFAIPHTASAGWLYVLNDDPAGSRIYGFQVNETTGELTALAGFPVATGGIGGNALVCERMTLDWANGRLYVVDDGSDTLSGFAVDRSTGALSPMSFNPVQLGTGTWNTVSVDPSGTIVIATNGATGGGAMSFVVTATTATPAPGNPYALGAATAFSSTFSRDGGYFYVGGNTGNNFAGFSVDGATGALTALAGSPFNSGAGNPVAYATDSQGRFFAVNTGSTASPPPIRVFTTSAGIPTPVTGSPFNSAMSQRRDALIHPNGSFYVVAGNSGNNVGVFQIGGTGAGTTLVPVAGSPFPAGGSTANVVAINEAGTHLYLGNRLSRNLTRYSMDTTTGVLTNLGLQPSNTMGSTGFISGIEYVSAATAPASISGQITASPGGGVGNVSVRLQSMSGSVDLVVRTNAFGYYSFPAVPTGVTYTVTPLAKGYTFTPPSIQISHTGEVTDANFSGQEN